MICTDENSPVIFSLSPGNFVDAPCGRDLIYKLGKQKSKNTYLWIELTRGTILVLWLKNPWPYDHNLYKLRNNIERAFCKIKSFRHIFTRYDMLDSMFFFFVFLAFIVISLLRVNTT